MLQHARVFPIQFCRSLVSAHALQTILKLPVAHVFIRRD